MLQRLIRTHNISVDDVVAETQSFDTVMNAFMVRTMLTPLLNARRAITNAHTRARTRGAVANGSGSGTNGIASGGGGSGSGGGTTASGSDGDGGGTGVRGGSGVVGDVELRVVNSDFHIGRSTAALKWVLSLTPSLLATTTTTSSSSSSSSSLPMVRLTAAPVSSAHDFTAAERDGGGDSSGGGGGGGGGGGNGGGMAARLQHEMRGVRQINDNAKRITTLDAFVAWLFLGGHKGVRAFTQRGWRRFDDDKHSLHGGGGTQNTNRVGW
jgi:hypothetical protein